MSAELKLGQYEHYKKKPYEVLGIGIHSETQEEYVIYKALYGDEIVWLRPKAMFLEDVVVDGVTMPRFRLIKEK